MKRNVLCALAWTFLAGIALADDKNGPLIRSARSGPWSAATTWEANAMPSAGARVQIRTGHVVTYDVASDAIIRSIHVAGTLTFARDRNTALNVGLIKIQTADDASEDGFNCDAHLAPPDPNLPRATLEVGTAEGPIPAEHVAMIRLAAIDGMDKETCPAIICCGGRMDLHGAPLSRTWVKLGAHANAGDTEIKLAEAITGWRVGDHVIVTTTNSKERINSRKSLRSDNAWGSDARTKFPPQTEDRTIKALSGDGMELDRPLDESHLGEGDYRGEVANLSRNVIIESLDPVKGRGHTMYHRYSTGSISYVELRHMGKEGLLGKYPIHVHLAGETMRGSYVQGASIWDSGNRWVTVHGTNYFIVRDCVGYQAVGHGFFLEDGSEVFNVFDRNLGVQCYVGKPLPDQALPFDHNDGAGFWWANSLNTFTRNVAVECDRYGFRFEATPTKGFDLRRPILRPDGTTERVDVRTLSFVRFQDNETHDQLFGMNLGGLGGDFFRSGVGDVVPAAGSPFVLSNTRIWNAHWAFSPFTRYAIDNLDIADCTYGLFLPAYDTQVTSGALMQRSKERANWGRITFTRTSVPIRLPDIGPKYYGEPFDLMEFAGDMLPPATVITDARKTADGTVVVHGTTSENETVARVFVNGHEAHAIDPNYATWEITIAAPADGKIKAFAVDRSGNVEKLAHVVQLRRDYP